MAKTVAVTMAETTPATMAKTTPAAMAGTKSGTKPRPLNMAEQKKAMACFKAADVMIAQAMEKYLPPMPHLLELPKGTKSILFDKDTLEKLHNERRHTLFSNDTEWAHMQYMTCVNVNNRGVTTTRGAWEADMEFWQLSPEQAGARSRSNSSTPKAEGTKTYKVKMTPSEYKHWKLTGEKPASQRATASPTPDTQTPTNHNSINAESLSTELEQVLSTGTAEAKKGGAKRSAGTTLEVEKESSQPSQGSTAQPSRSNGTTSLPVASTSMHATNGNTAPSSHAKRIAGTEMGLNAPLEKPVAGHSATNGAGKSAAPSKTVTNGLNSSSKNGSTTNGDVSSSHSQSASNSGKASSSQAPKYQSVSRANGVSGSRETLQSKESNKDVTRPAQSVPHNNSTLPKKPVVGKSGNESSKSSLSTPNASFSSSQQASKKRPSPLPDHGPAEKRAKTDHSRTPSNPYNPVRKPDPSGLPPKPKVFGGPTSNPSPRPGNLAFGLGLSSISKSGNKDVRKVGGTPRPGSSTTGTPRSDTPRSDMTRDLPPPLSPLHPTFESSPLSEPPTSSAPSNFSKNKKHEEPASSAKKLIDKGKGVVKRQDQRSESPDRVSRPLPKLLSPDLPAVIEEALNEVKNQKKTFATVEQRHELARQDGAPGVARIVKSKSSRKTVAAPEPDTQEEPDDSDDDHRLTTLKFKKKSRASVDWITKSRPQPGRGLTSKPLPDDFSLKLHESDDEDDAPLAKTAAKRRRPNDDEHDAHLARKTTKKQRPDDANDVPQAKAGPNKKRPAESMASEPAPKRAKAESRDVTRTSAAASTARKSTPVPAARTSTPVPTARLASPAPSAPSNKSLLATPKRGDAMRSVAMRKVDSSEGLARTPQPNMESTPGSVDRSRVNPTSEPRPQNAAEVEKLRSVANSAEALALKIKRKMDELLKLKSDLRVQKQVSEKDKKQGLATGLESVTAYMNCYFRNDRIALLNGTTRNCYGWKSIMGLLGFLTRECQSFPVLHALTSQISAICHDQLERSYLEQKDPAKKLDNWDAMERNNKSKVAAWNMAEEKKGVLVPFSGGQTLGPWSDIKDITTHAIGIITAYSRKEQSGWKKDPEFSTLLS